MRYPKNLQNGGTIGFVAPSYGASTEPYKSLFDNALLNFTTMGYKLNLGPNCYCGEGVGISNTPQLCGKELTESYCSKDSDVLISVGGGELLCETLDYVDLDRIKEADPKWFMGYSDNTHFTFLLPTICDTASVYAPCASSFGMSPWHTSVYDAFAVLKGEKLSFSNYDFWELHEDPEETCPYKPYNCTEPFDPVVYDPNGNVTDFVNMEGRIIGGCLDCLANISGTNFDKVADFCERYKEDGIIWFMESCDLSTMDARRALWRLKHTGWFKYVKGFIFGRPYRYDDNYSGLSWEDATLAPLNDLHVPVIRNADLGHLPPMMPVICGALASVDATTEKVNIKYTEA